MQGVGCRVWSVGCRVRGVKCREYGVVPGDETIMHLHDSLYNKTSMAPALYITRLAWHLLYI